MNIILDVEDKYLNNIRITILNTDKVNTYECIYYDDMQRTELNKYVLEVNDEIYYISSNQYNYIKKERA